jgi:hypothetical protein
MKLSMWVRLQQLRVIRRTMTRMTGAATKLPARSLALAQPKEDKPSSQMQPAAAAAAAAVHHDCLQYPLAIGDSLSCT